MSGVTLSNRQPPTIEAVLVALHLEAAAVDHFSFAPSCDAEST
jgi:hypothetical protein